VVMVERAVHWPSLPHVTASAVKSNSSATCTGGQASVSGGAQLVGLTVAACNSINAARPKTCVSRNVLVYDANQMGD
jgi:hypothetical protein